MHPLDKFQFCPSCGSNKFQEHSTSSKKCANCGFEFFKNPAPAVAGFIFNNKNQLLITKRGKDPAINTWDLPGGFVDLNEQIEQAMIREAKEELNIDIKIKKFLFSLPNNYMYSGFNVQTIDAFFLCTTEDYDKIEREKEEISDFMFVDIDKLNPDEFGLESIRKAVKMLIEENKDKQQRFS